jgi:hypothetical protein
MQNAKTYTIISKTDNGDSQFEDAQIDLVERQVSAGVPPMSVGALQSNGGVVYLRSEQFDSEPHPAPRKQWVVMLRGTLEVQVTDGSKRRFSPGDLILVTDTSGKGHITLAIGEPPFEALFVPVE